MKSKNPRLHAPDKQKKSEDLPEHMQNMQTLVGKRGDDAGRRRSQLLGNVIAFQNIKKIKESEEPPTPEDANAKQRSKTISPERRQNALQVMNKVAQFRFKSFVSSYSASPER